MNPTKPTEAQIEERERKEADQFIEDCKNGHVPDLIGMVEASGHIQRLRKQLAAEKARADAYHARNQVLTNAEDYAHAAQSKIEQLQAAHAVAVGQIKVMFDAFEEWLTEVGLSRLLPKLAATRKEYEQALERGEGKGRNAS